MLLMDKVEKALERVQDRIEGKFEDGHPYVTISLKRIKKEMDITQRSGINFLVRKLKEDYHVGKDADWLIVEKKG